MIQKNDLVTVEITDQSSTGDGIGKADGFPLFVRHAVMGDTAEVTVTALKKSYGYARINKIIKPSIYRKEPDCPCYKRCGGCQMLSMSYEGQAVFKTNLVKQALIRIGGFKDIEVEPIEKSELIFHYRNKAQYPVGITKSGELCSGFYAGRTHEIIPNDDCLLSPPEFSDIVKSVLSWMKKYNIFSYDEKTCKGIVRHIFIRKGFRTGEIGVCIIINAKKLKFKDELVRCLNKFDYITGISYSSNMTGSNVIMGDSVICIYGNECIKDMLGSVSYSISPLSFFQINPKQAEKLYTCVKDFAGLKGGEIVWDLYCGIGSISLFMAKEAEKIVGIEVVKRAVDDAKKNAKLNGYENAEYYFGDVSEVFPTLYKQNSAKENIVIVDPPRKGCDEKTLDTLLLMRPEKIIYVSCNPSTLARDLKILCNGGYTIKRVKPFDLFPQTVHVETCVLLAKTSDSEV